VETLLHSNVRRQCSTVSRHFLHLVLVRLCGRVCGRHKHRTRRVPEAVPKHFGQQPVFSSMAYCYCSELGRNKLSKIVISFRGAPSGARAWVLFFGPNWHGSKPGKPNFGGATKNPYKPLETGYVRKKEVNCVQNSCTPRLV